MSDPDRDGGTAAGAAVWERYSAVALDLVRAADEAGVTLRLVGSVACRLHCEGQHGLLEAMGRENPPDVDMVTTGSDRARARDLLRSLSYEEDRNMLVAMEGRRYAFREPKLRLHVDLFVDRLEFCHPIDVTGRFGLDHPTLSLADLVLSKLQIVQINQKDLKDLVALVLEHDLGPDDREAIDAAYIARLASQDWGLYYTISRNLERVRQFAAAGPLTEVDRELIGARLGALWRQIEGAPKPLKWRLRAKVGPRVRWYEDVEEPEPAF